MAELGDDRSTFGALANVRRMRRHFTRERVAAWPRRAPERSGAAPVFLLGFPRSGTTLLDTMLSSHPDPLVLEERDLLGGAYARFAASDAALDDLEGLHDDALREARREYWQRVDAELRGTRREGRLVVDKLPLNTILLGLIARIFPDARVLLAVRDPRDACLSCFQQRFDLNPAMINFLSWESTVAYYDEVMGAGMEVLEAGVLAWHRIRYEHLVDAPRDALAPLLSFLGLPWDDAVLDYRRTARERYTATPSAEQVVRPLYRSSVGRFRHYEEWMKPEIETLTPGWSASAMPPEPGREGQPGRTRGALAALLLAAFAAALPEDVPAQPSVRPIEEREAEKPVSPEAAMPDSPVQLPAFPRGRDLVELDSASFEQGVRVFLDPASLSQPAPELVRYTMLLVSSKGTGNLFFEGIDCDREEWRTLAFGTGEGTFELIRNPRWRTLRAGANAGTVGCSRGSSCASWNAARPTAPKTCGGGSSTAARWRASDTRRGSTAKRNARPISRRGSHPPAVAGPAPRAASAWRPR